MNKKNDENKCDSFEHLYKLFTWGLSQHTIHKLKTNKKSEWAGHCRIEIVVSLTVYMVTNNRAILLCGFDTKS